MGDLEQRARSLGKDTYRHLLLELLTTEVYPLIFHKLGVDVDQSTGLKLFQDAMRTVSTEGDLDLAHFWMRVESTMRNESGIAQAASLCNQLRQIYGMPPLGE